MVYNLRISDSPHYGQFYNTPNGLRFMYLTFLAGISSNSLVDDSINYSISNGLVFAEDLTPIFDEDDVISRLNNYYGCTKTTRKDNTYSSESFGPYTEEYRFLYNQANLRISLQRGIEIQRSLMSSFYWDTYELDSACK